MLIRTLGILPLSLLLFAGVSYAAPVNLVTDAGPIFYHQEATVCDVSVRPNQSGCTTTSSDPAATFQTPLAATLSVSGTTSTVTIAASVWDANLFATLDNGAPGSPCSICYNVGSASNAVLQINNATGAPISWSWTASIFSTALGSTINLSAKLFQAAGQPPGGEAYGGVLTPGTPPVAVACGSGGISGTPIAGECTGANFVANENYDSATGALFFMAVSDIVPGLFPLAWAPVDVKLTNNGVIPEPGTVLLLGAGLLGLATVGRKRS